MYKLRKMCGEVSEKDHLINFVKKFMKKETCRLILCRLRKDILELKWAIIAVIACFILAERLSGSVCPLVCVTGLPCPSCGFTRAGIAALHLDFAKAWTMHPFLFPIGVWLAVAAYERYFQGKCRLSPVLRAAGGALLAGMLLFYIYRMYMYFPDSPPMIYSDDNLLRYILGIVKQ